MGKPQTPQITEVAELKKRQQQALSTIWTPITNGASVSCMFTLTVLNLKTLIYTSLGKLTSCDPGKTIYTYSNYWQCCLSASACPVVAQCNAGTVVDLAGNSKYWYQSSLRVWKLWLTLLH